MSGTTSLRLTNPRSSVIPLKLNYQKTISILGNWSKVDFGINFENDGLRVKAQLERMKIKNYRQIQVI